MIRFLSLSLLLLNPAKITNGERECYSSRTDFYNFFSTKTSYFSVVDEKKDFDAFQVEGRLINFNWLNNHG